MLKQTKLHVLHIGQSLPLAILSTAAMCAAAPAASAAEPPSVDAQIFSILDVNQDGYVDRKEASSIPSVAKVFDAADLDKDNRLSPAEYAKAPPQKP